MQGKALVRFVNVRRPISGEIIGMRLQAAVPNMQGRVMRAREVGGDVEFRATKEPAPSWRKPYLIEQSGDEPYITHEVVRRFCQRLNFEGYTDFEYVGEELQEMMLGAK